MAAAALTSNSLRVSFPGTQEVSFPAVHEELSSFGAIAALELPSCSDYHTAFAVVGYYDVRAAEQAASSLGPRCGPAPSHGERCVQLDGDITLDASLLTDIAAVHRDEAQYTIVFYDIRDAARARAAADGAKVEAFGDAVEAPAKVEREAAAAERRSVNALMRLSLAREGPALGSPWVGPRYANSLRISEVKWSDVKSGLETRTTLRLRGLPRQLGTPGALEAMLATAKLLDHVDCVRVHPPRAGARLGSAFVNVALPEHVSAVARFFHGKQVGRSGPIAVSFATVQGVEALQRGVPQAEEVRRVRPGPPAGPRRIDLDQVDCDPHGASEVSTDAGTGDDADSAPDCCPELPSEPCRVVFPPPGLSCKVHLGFA